MFSEAEFSTKFLRLPTSCLQVAYKLPTSCLQVTYSLPLLRVKLPEGMTGPLEHVYIFNRENGISMTYAGDIKEAVYMPIKLIFQ